MSVPDSDKGKWAIEELPKKWEWIDFNLFFFDRTSASKKVPQKEYLTIGKIAIIDQGEDFIGGYTNDDSLIYDDQLPVIIWGDHTRIIKLVNSPFVQGADGVKVLQPSQIVNTLYAYYAMKAIELPNKGYSRHFKFLKESSFPVAPFNEQRRIVDKLERIGDRHRTARNELNHIPKLIARYKQAVLAAACSGKLTEDWRIKQNLEDSWQSTTLGEIIIDKPKNGYSAKPVQYETPFRVLTLTATTSGKFNPEHFKYFEEPIEEKSQFWLQPNDILIQRGNTIEYVGVPAIYDGFPNQFIFPDLMIRLRAKENVTTQFLYLVLSCENSRQYLRDRATGTAGSMPKINQTTLISLPIELPRLEEQKEIVWRVEKMFEKIDRMEQEYQKAAKLCDRLEQATLAKAFRGELVPQDPDDEPASVLLEQVKREKEKGKKVRM